MASIPYSTVAASKMFTILLGPDEKAFHIHADLLAAQSPVLFTLVKGNMKEATEGVARCPELEEHSFVLFFEFAYTGDYTVQDQKVVVAQSTVPDTVDTAAESPANNTKHDETRSDSAAKNSRKQTRSPGKNLLDAVLPHINVYIFADYYDIKKLADLSLTKLKGSFPKSSVIVDQVEELIQITDIVWQNTVNKGPRLDPLRELVTKRITRHIRKLWDAAGFQDALVANGELSKHIIGHMFPTSGEVRPSTKVGFRGFQWDRVQPVRIGPRRIMVDVSRSDYASESDSSSEPDSDSDSDSSSEPDSDSDSDV